MSSIAHAFWLDLPNLMYVFMYGMPNDVIECNAALDTRFRGCTPSTEDFFVGSELIRTM